MPAEAYFPMPHNRCAGRLVYVLFARTGRSRNCTKAPFLHANERAADAHAT